MEKTQGFDVKPTIVGVADPTNKDTKPFTVAPPTGPPPVTFAQPPKKKVINVNAKN